MLFQFFIKRFKHIFLEKVPVWSCFIWFMLSNFCVLAWKYAKSEQINDQNWDLPEWLWRYNLSKPMFRFPMPHFSQVPLSLRRLALQNECSWPYGHKFSLNKFWQLTDQKTEYRGINFHYWVMYCQFCTIYFRNWQIQKVINNLEITTKMSFLLTRQQIRNNIRRKGETKRSCIKTFSRMLFCKKKKNILFLQSCFCT